MEERIVNEVDGAVQICLDAEEELQWATGFVARWEGDVRELALGVGDVFAGLTVEGLVKFLFHFCAVHGVIHSPVQAADGYLLADAVALLDQRFLCCCLCCA